MRVSGEAATAESSSRGFPDAGEAAASTRDARAPLEPPIVLVVEDDPMIQHLIREAMAGQCRVELASDGAEGLRLAVALQPDLVVTDLVMPTMTGVQLLHAIRTVAELDDTPVIILTSSADEVVRVQLLREGAQDFLLKPFSIPELRARMDNLVRTARARRLLKRELASQRDDVDLLAEEVTRRKREAEGALAAMRAARDHAQHASEIKSMFLGLVSHELRTPLAALGLQVHLLRTSELTPRQLEIASRIDRSSQRLLALIESLLERARIEVAGITARPAPFDLGDVVEGALAEHAHEASRKGLALGCSGAAGIELVSDAHLLRLILSSLLENAVKFTESGEITVVATREGPQCRVAVRDTGAGISAADQLRLFMPFEHLAPIEHKHTPGFGLGLALVRDLAQALGATVDIESVVGVGSTFTLRLPLEHP